MTQRRMVVAGNWKMNGTDAFIEELLSGIVKGLDDLSPSSCEVLVFPPFIYLSRVASQLADHAVGVGSQDVDVRSEGAVTGAVSAAMVRDCGGRYSIIGHSERRSLFAEPDDQ